MDSIGTKIGAGGLVSAGFDWSIYEFKPLRFAYAWRRPASTDAAATVPKPINRPKNSSEESESNRPAPVFGRVVALPLPLPVPLPLPLKSSGVLYQSHTTSPAGASKL